MLASVADLIGTIKDIKEISKTLNTNRSTMRVKQITL